MENYQEKKEEAEEWAGLTTSSIGQTVDSKWLERLQGDVNDLNEARAARQDDNKIDVLHKCILLLPTKCIIVLRLT